MKKIFVFVAIATFMTLGFTGMAQNKFKGIVKYNLTAEGVDAKKVAEQLTNLSLKVMGDQFYADGYMTTLLTKNGTINCMIQNGNTMTVALNFSDILTYLDMQGVSLTTYQGTGKILTKNEITQSEIDSLTIPCTEGFYIEYLEETKTIAGETAKLARIHSFDEDGVDHPEDVWYSPEMGPAPNMAFGGINGIVLEKRIKLDEDNTLILTASEIVKGKVKDVDFLMPSGYEKLSDEDLEAFSEELSEEIKALQGEEE